MEMHPYFTQISSRRIAQINYGGRLSEILLALVSDMRDVGYIRVSEIRGASISVFVDGGQNIEAPIRMDDFIDLGPDAFNKMKLTVFQWVMKTQHAGESLRDLSIWNRRFGSWCACQVVRDSLRDAIDLRPHHVIDVVEAWSMGTASMTQLRSISAEAEAAASYASGLVSRDEAGGDPIKAAVSSSGANVAFAARSVAWAATFGGAWMSEAAAQRLGMVAGDVARAAAFRSGNKLESPEWRESYASEVVRLNEIVASASIAYRPRIAI